MFVGTLSLFASFLFACNLVLASAIAVANAVLAASISADVPALLAALSNASCKAALLIATTDVSSAAWSLKLTGTTICAASFTDLARTAEASATAFVKAFVESAICSAVASVLVKSVKALAASAIVPSPAASIPYGAVAPAAAVAKLMACWRFCSATATAESNADFAASICVLVDVSGLFNNVSKADCASVTAFSVATATGIDLIATEAFDVDVARASCALATALANSACALAISVAVDVESVPKAFCKAVSACCTFVSSWTFTGTLAKAFLAESCTSAKDCLAEATNEANLAEADATSAVVPVSPLAAAMAVFNSVIAALISGRSETSGVTDPKASDAVSIAASRAFSADAMAFVNASCKFLISAVDAVEPSLMAFSKAVFALITCVSFETGFVSGMFLAAESFAAANVASAAVSAFVNALTAASMAVLVDVSGASNNFCNLSFAAMTSVSEAKFLAMFVCAVLASAVDVLKAVSAAVFAFS